MTLPNLNEHGELPAGVHQTTLTELLTQFGTGTRQRREVGRRLKLIHEVASWTGSLDRMVVFGSFVTNKSEPRDVDVVLIMKDEFKIEHCSAATSALFDHTAAEQAFGASVFWIRPSLLILQSLDDFIAGWQQKRGGGQRGIVEVTQ